jgi:branched-chain amino acid transport system substrate-binding protein
LGGEILAEEGTPPDARDYRTILTKVKGLNPELIYFPSYPEGGIAAMNQAQELQITTQFLGGDAWADPKFVAEASGKANIIHSEVVSPVSPDSFQSKVAEKTGSNQVPICAPQAYDAVKLLSIVMMSVGTDTDKMQESLHNFVYNGISGSISFDANGDLTRAEYKVKKIENGTSTEVK